MVARVKVVWAFIHNCVAHPLLFWSGDARWAVRLHDHSARSAWPGRDLRAAPKGWGR